MVQLVVFLLVLALVYALKAVAIARSHEELVADDAAFSWMNPTEYEKTLARAQAIRQEELAKAAAPASATATVSVSRRVQGTAA